MHRVIYRKGARAFKLNVIKWALIIALVIQPVANSFAMVRLSDCSMPTTKSMILHSIASGHHDMVHLLKAQAQETTQMSSSAYNTHTDSIDQDGCCQSAAFSAVVVSSTASELGPQNFCYYLPVSASLRSISLPTEIKPPRNLLN